MSDPVFGKQQLTSGSTEYNQLAFVITQFLSRMNTATLVKVQAVTPGPGLLVGTVDILPMVNQVDGEDKAVPHTTIYGVPYFRVQGGANAVIVDPIVGDVGFVVFADHDISSVKETGQQANPGSARRFDMADAMYFGGWNTNVAPTSYVQVTQSAINIVLNGATSAILTDNLLTVNANLKVNGTAEVTGDTKLDSTLEVTALATMQAAMEVGGVISSVAGGSTPLTISVPIVAQSTITSTGEITANGHTLTSHTHGGVTSGGASTSTPTG